MSENVDMFGWELVFKIYENVIKNKSDLLMCFIHWIFIRRGFRCAGVGEDTVLPKLDTLTELLPAGWNNDISYKIRYVYNKQVYLVSGLQVEDELVFTLNRPVDERVFGTSIALKIIEQEHGPIKTLIPEAGDTVMSFTQDVIDQMLQIEVNKEVETQTSDDLLDAEPTRVYRSVHEVELPRPPTFPTFVDVGFDDLNPFGRGGGGMIFPTPGFGPRANRPDAGLPRGSVPPGARYDPIRPPLGRPRPSPSRGPHPDHDHFPPPGYDDMFM